MPVIITNPFEGKRAIPSDNRLQFRIASTTNTLNVIPETELNEMNFPVRYIESGSTGYSWSIHNVSDVEQSGILQEIHPTGKIPSAPGGTSEFDEGVDNYFGDDVSIASATAPLSLSDYKIVNGYVNVNLDFDEATVYGQLQNYTDPNKKFDFKFNYVGGYDWPTWTGMTGIAVRDCDKVYSEKTFGSRKDFIFEFLPGTAPSTFQEFKNQMFTDPESVPSNIFGTGNTFIEEFESDGTIISFNYFNGSTPLGFIFYSTGLTEGGVLEFQEMPNLIGIIGNFRLFGAASNKWYNLEYIQLDCISFLDFTGNRFARFDKLKELYVNFVNYNNSSIATSKLFQYTPIALERLYITSILRPKVMSSLLDFPPNYFSNLDINKTTIITTYDYYTASTIQNYIASGGTVLLSNYFKCNNLQATDALEIVNIFNGYQWKNKNSFWSLETSGNYFSGSQNSYFEGIELNVTSPNPTGFSSQNFLYPALHYFTSGITGNFDSQTKGSELMIFDSYNYDYSVELNNTYYNSSADIERWKTNGAQCIFRLSGSNSESLFLSQDQYKFLIELYINGNLHSTHEIYSKPGEPAFFDASTIAKSVTPKALIPSQPIDNTYSNSTVQIKVREMIGDTLIEEYATSEVIDIWKGRLDEQQFNLFDYREHTLLPATTGVTFLTDYPRHEKRAIKRNDNFYGGFLATNLLASYKQNLKLKFATYDDNMVETGFIMGSCLPVWNNDLGERIKVGTFNLYSELWLDLPENSGATMTQQDVDDASFMSVMQYYSGTTGTKSGETLVYELMDEDCNLGRTIHWMNKYGVMETFYFVKEMDEETDIDSHKIEKGAFNLDLINNGEYDYLKTARDFITLRTDYLPEDVYNWLVKEVIESPLILIDIDGVQYRANVESDKWEAKTHRHNKIFFWEVKFQLSNVRYSPLVG